MAVLFSKKGTHSCCAKILLSPCDIIHLTMQATSDAFFYYLIYLLPMVLSAITSLWLAVFIWRNKNQPGSKTFAWLMLDVTVWSLNTGLLELSPTPELALIFYKLRYLSIATVPTLLFIFSLQYSGFFPRISTRAILGLFVIPLLSQLVIWFAPDLFVQDVLFSWNGALMMIEHDVSGPWFAVHFVYAFLSVTAGLLVTLLAGMQSGRLVRWQAKALVLGSLPPFALSAVLATFVDKSLALFTPLGFLIMGLIYTWALFRIRLFDLNSISRSFLFDHMGEVVLLVDATDCIVDINQAGGRLFGQPVRQLIGQKIQALIPIPDEAAFNGPTALEVPCPTVAGKRWLSVKITPLHLGRGRGGEKLLLIEDISARKISQLALRQVYEITAIVNETQALNQLLAKSLEVTLVTASSPAGLIALLGENEQTLQIAVSQGITPDVVASSPVLAFCQAVVQMDQFTFSEEIKLDFAGADYHLLGFPIKKQGRKLGALCLALKPTPPAARETTDLLSAIADQLGIAVESARLLGQAEQTAVTLERQRLARELHDSVTQSIYGAVLLAKVGRNFFEQGRNAEAAHALQRVEDVSQQALKEMRLLIYELHPLNLQMVGLSEAIRQRLMTVENRVDIQVQFVYDSEVEICGETAAGLYGIVQEALNNVVKHSHATQVVVSLQADRQTIRLVVEDNGVGFDPMEAKKSGGMGLTGMRERAERLNGTLSMHCGAKTGTCLTMNCPTPDDAVWLDTAQQIK